MHRYRFTAKQLAKFEVNSGALWQESNSKIENYWFLASVNSFQKVLQSF